MSGSMFLRVSSMYIELDMQEVFLLLKSEKEHHRTHAKQWLTYARVHVLLFNVQFLAPMDMSDS